MLLLELQAIHSLDREEKQSLLYEILVLTYLVSGKFNELIGLNNLVQC